MINIFFKNIKISDKYILNRVIIISLQTIQELLKDMDYKEIMPNDKIIVMINDIHNKWWKSAREFDEKSDKDEVAKSMQVLVKYVETNYSSYPIACKIMEAYIDELDARVKGGYRSFEGEKEKNERR